MLAVGLSANEVKNLPAEFQSLGVDVNGAPVAVDPATGQPDLNKALFNIFVYNRAAGTTLLVALNAAEDGSDQAKQNANNLIASLNDFGKTLDHDLQNLASSQIANTFSNLSSVNNVNMLGKNASVQLVNNSLQFAYVTPGLDNNGRPINGKANVYFNSSTYLNDPTLTGWVKGITENGGVQSDVKEATDPAFASSADFIATCQADQPFISAYRALDISSITGVPGFTTPIFACAVNPTQMSHLVDLVRFKQSSTAPPGSYAPANAVQGQTQTQIDRPALLTTAIASAVLSSLHIEYPILMPNGYVRIHNAADSIYAGKNASPQQVLDPVPKLIIGAGSIFNNELWPGVGGLGGIYVASNGVFATVDYDAIKQGDKGPAGYNGITELQAWVNYNNSSTKTVSDPTLLDKDGHDSTLDPSTVLGYISPTDNMRITGNYQQTATRKDMLGVTAILGGCNGFMYATAGGAPPLCADPNFGLFKGNYTNSVPSANSGYYYTGSNAVGGITNLEYLKGEIIGQWSKYVDNDLENWVWTNYVFNLVVPQNPSGSKLYDRTNAVGYAVPSSTRSDLAFGTIGTPLQLIQQLYSDRDSQNLCANSMDTNNLAQWNDPSTTLGKLLQRCREICPNTQPSDLVTLLAQYPIDLGQYQYIYLPPGGAKLSITDPKQSPPGFLKILPEFSNPGTTLPDGTPLPICKDALWDESGAGSSTGATLTGNVINAQAAVDGGPPENDLGDLALHDQPFTQWSGNISTSDGMVFTPSSGAHDFLGELTFQNFVFGDDKGNGNTFSQPN